MITSTMNQEIFLKGKWLENHLSNIKLKAKQRYTPELNVEIPISKIFDGISRTERFYVEIRENYGKLVRDFKHVASKYDVSELQEEYKKIQEIIVSLCELLENIKDYNVDPIPWKKIHKKSKDASEALWEFSDNLRKEKDRVGDVKVPPRDDGGHQASPAENLGNDIHYVYKTQESLRYFEEFSLSSGAHLSNNPFLLLAGSAGNGKTHLLCDVVEHRIKGGQVSLPAILVFGEYFFNGEDFWVQVFRQLGIEETIKTKERFLNKLNSLGKRLGVRSIFIIDALNENTTQAPNFWKKNLDDVIKEIRSYPHVGFVISIRNGYERRVLHSATEKTLIKKEHHGFPQEVMWDAMGSFFKYYNITFDIPLLHPEFYNPLFLKFFCEKNKNSKPNLKGGNALKDVFEDFVIEVGLEVLKKIDPKARKRENGKNALWDGVVKDMALWMANNGETKIPAQDLKNIIKKYFPKNENQVIDLMEKRVLLNKIEWEKRVSYSFPYNKFSDHIIVRSLLSSLDKKKKTDAFKENGRLWQALKNFRYDSGILEAMCIQVPEVFRKEKRKEIFELAPYILDEDNFETSYKESLIWRDPSTIDKKVIGIIQRNIRKKSDFFLEPLLSLASFPDSVLNARLLHSLLSNFSMSERDSWWSVFIHNEYGKQGAVDRLLQWSWSNQKRTYLDSDSVFLTAITLSWFLTTPNRFVRDRATKGLVCLLQERINLVPELLEFFKNTNDPYITERLFCVAYACTLRNQGKKSDVRGLAEWIFKNTFKDNNPPVHILIRDYGRGIIESTRKIGVKLNFDERACDPPYETNWSDKVPTEKALRRKYYPEDYFKDKTKERGFLDIWSSVMHSYGTLGDFGNYVLDSHLSPWSGRRRINPEKRRTDMFAEFHRGLNAKQKKLLELMTNQFSKLNLLSILENIRISTIENTDKFTKEEQEKEKLKEATQQKNNVTRFENSLSEKKRKFFRGEIKPFLDSRGVVIDPLDLFDTKLAQRWVFNRVVQLGYNPKLHGEFDLNVNRYDDSGRSEHKAERIGKKYQWIAYHEFMALVSDHFQFKGNSWSNSDESSYRGPWEPYIRDIDPSFILQDDTHIKHEVNLSQWKLSDGAYDGWDKRKTDLNWMKEADDLPDPRKIIQIMDDNKKEWLILEGFVDWEQSIPPEHKKYDLSTREVWYMLKSYIVKKKDAKKFYAWLSDKSFMGRWMPESHNFYEVFLGEYPNSMAFEDIRGDYNVWTKDGKGKGNLPIKVVVTDDVYLNEFTRDCSYNGSVSIKLPCKWLVNKMKLSHHFLDGRFYDEKGNLVTIPTGILMIVFHRLY
jgi:hypothetical protein